MANVCCFYSLVLGIFKSASFIFRFEWLKLFCMQRVRSRGQRRVTSLELILNAFISLWQLACVLSWWKESAEINDDISLYWCCFSKQKRGTTARHSDSPQLRPGNWARAKQSRSFFLYSFSSTFKSKIKFLELDIQTLRRKGTLQCPVSIIQTS